MPLLIYGADVSIEEDITLKKFIELVDDSSWEEFMPKGVSKEIFNQFLKYYDEDVFIAAGKRIRNLVKQADDLPITGRINKIAEIFGYFRNPDKERFDIMNIVDPYLSSSSGSIILSSG